MLSTRTLLRTRAFRSCAGWALNVGSAHRSHPGAAFGGTAWEEGVRPRGRRTCPDRKSCASPPGAPSAVRCAPSRSADRPSGPRPLFPRRPGSALLPGRLGSGLPARGSLTAWSLSGAPRQEASARELADRSRLRRPPREAGRTPRAPGALPPPRLPSPEPPRAAVALQSTRRRARVPRPSGEDLRVSDRPGAPERAVNLNARGTGSWDEASATHDAGDAGSLGWSDGSVPLVPLRAVMRCVAADLEEDTQLRAVASPLPFPEIRAPSHVPEATPACPSHRLINIVPCRFSDPSWGKAMPHFFCCYFYEPRNSVPNWGTFKWTQTRPPLHTDTPPIASLCSRPLLHVSCHRKRGETGTRVGPR